MPDPVPSIASYTGGCLCGTVRLECRAVSGPAHL
jgi:hypothetical protein